MSGHSGRIFEVNRNGMATIWPDRSRRQLQPSSPTSSTNKDPKRELRGAAALRWALLAIGTGFYCIIAMLIQSTTLPKHAPDHEMLGVTTSILACTALLAIRVIQCYPYYPYGDYSSWRKAIQKPIDVLASLFTFLLLYLTSEYSGALESIPRSIGYTFLGLLSWVPFVWLAGSSGADIAAWKDGLARNRKQILTARIACLGVPLILFVLPFVTSRFTPTYPEVKVTCSPTGAAGVYKCSPPDAWRKDMKPKSPSTLPKSSATPSSNTAQTDPTVETFPEFYCSAPDVTIAPSAVPSQRAPEYVCTQK